MKLLKTTPVSTLIICILALFALKGVFLSVLMPFFQNPDEQVHYGTLQHWAEPAIKTWEIKAYPKGTYFINPEDVRTSNLPQETRESAAGIGFDEIKFQPQNTQDFSDKATESSINANTWSRWVDTTPSAVSGTQSWYYLVSSWIERWLADQDIFTRMLAIRLFSVLLGFMTVWLAYLALLKIGFSRIESTLITGLIAFQPMLGITAAQINIDIALIFAFALFTYAGISLIASRGKQAILFGALALAASIIGITAKGPGIVLVALTPLLLGYTIWTRFGEEIKKKISSLGMSQRSLWLSAFFALLVIGAALSTVIPSSYISSITNASATSKFDSPIASLAAYLDKTMDIDAFRWSALSYWGNFGWLDTSIHDSVFNLIWTVEIITLIGLLLYLIPWRPKRFPVCLSGNRDFLPAKYFIIALLLLSLALEFAIRFYDWRVFDATTKILIGTPGRYFLPNIAAHMTLLVTGLGFFCRSRIQFHWLLKSLLVLMLLLQLYSMFDIILPRYYL